jgi:hypothetical protein
VTAHQYSTSKPVVFAAMSKRNFFLREHIIKFILEKHCTPTCAFMMFSYFLLDTVKREALIEANNDLIRRSDELWVFGEISDGVYAEIKLAQSLNKPLRFFTAGQLPNGISEITSTATVYENEFSGTQDLEF